MCVCEREIEIQRYGESQRESERPIKRHMEARVTDGERRGRGNTRKSATATSRMTAAAGSTVPSEFGLYHRKLPHNWAY